MDQLIIDYGTHLVTQSRSIHDFVILLVMKCDKIKFYFYQN